MHHYKALIGVLAVIGSVLVGAGVPAGGAEGTHCDGGWDVTIDPGVSLTAGKGTFTTNGPTGTIECDGPVNGQTPSGVGKLSVDGETNGDCGGVEGPFKMSFTIPTESGDQVVDLDGKFTFGLRHGHGPLSGDIKSSRLNGTFDFAPSKGDCISAPVTAGHVTGHLYLTD